MNGFIQLIILKMFRKKSRLIIEQTTNRVYIKFQSKFIFDFIYNYVIHDEKRKTYTARLIKRTNGHTKEFREGCLLGLALSDGYIKNRFVFNVTSGRLAKNVYEILKNFGYNPHC